MKRIGEKLRILRERRGLSVTKLAEMLGVGHGHISRIESGLKRPSSDLILKIADLFEVSTNQLMRDELDIE
jgi:transcriptional regulator with XRE-family HTH domain